MTLSDNSNGAPDMDDRDRIEALLPFYLNGTLGTDDLAQVQSWLSANPDAEAALAAMEAEYEASVSANDAISLPRNALGRFNEALEAEAPKSAAGPSLLGRLMEKILGAPPALAWGTAAAALTLVVVQTIIPPADLAGDKPGTFTEAGVTEEKADTPYVLVVFAPEADIARISALMEETGASLAGGPKPGGIYLVNLPAPDLETYDRLSALLAADPAIAQLLPGRKPVSAY